MIRRSEDITPRVVKNAQGGNDEVTFYDWFQGAEAASHGRMFSKLVIPPGASIGYHDHAGEFEAYYVMSGEATVDDNGEEVLLRSGDMHLCQDGCGHSTTNNGTDNLVLMVMIMNSSM